MLEQKTDILAQDTLNIADAICFTSNGVVKSNGELVMGAGVAKAFKNKDSKLPLYAGIAVSSRGNKCQIISETLGNQAIAVIAFPTKHHWRAPSDINLIKKSATELMEILDTASYKINKVYLPRPGVGLGGLDWHTQVKPVLEKILDDRVIVCYK